MVYRSRLIYTRKSIVDYLLYICSKAAVVFDFNIPLLDHIQNMIIRNSVFNVRMHEVKQIGYLTVA